MLTELHLKNWRSLRDVTIDNLTPITVFIGANSSGKTNIVEALSFLRRMVQEDTPAATYFQAQQQKIRSLQANEQDPIELAFSFTPVPTKTLSYSLTIEPGAGQPRFIEQLADAEGSELRATDGKGTTHLKDGSTGFTGYAGNADGTPSLVLSVGRFAHRDSTIEKVIEGTFNFVAWRWQILHEGFAPLLTFPAAEYTNVYLIDSLAHNTLPILQFMQQQHPAVYAELQTDLAWLLKHVDSLEANRDEREIRAVIRESALGGQEAPTISAGTARLIAMLTAYYTLDMRTPELPGLVVIEEPDTAINPLLLRAFVELLRTYTERKGRPRQFILTTHNPRLLDWFEPEEVRVVERDPETGETSVKQIPDYIHETWLDEHTLGDAWLSRVIGGIPQE